MKAISGPAVGKELTWLPSEQLTWKAWREKYPHGEVLSTDTGNLRNYDGEAYTKPMFPVLQTRKDLKDKAWVIGIINAKLTQKLAKKGFGRKPERSFWNLCCTLSVRDKKIHCLNRWCFYEMFRNNAVWK